MAGITTASGGWRPSVHRPAPPSSGTLLFRVKPTWEHFVAEKMSLFAKKPLFYTARVSASIAGFRTHIAQEWGRRWCQMFVTLHVPALGESSAKRADFMRPKSPSARIPARKKFLKSGLTMDIRCPLPLGSSVD